MIKTRKIRAEESIDQTKEQRKEERPGKALKRKNKGLL